MSLFSAWLRDTRRDDLHHAAPKVRQQVALSWRPNSGSVQQPLDGIRSFYGVLGGQIACGLIVPTGACSSWPSVKIVIKPAPQCPDQILSWRGMKRRNI